MQIGLKWTWVGVMLLCGTGGMQAQVYSPKVLAQGQIDTTDLKSLAQGIYKNAHAVTEREKAEAIWRFYLTDGRFVKPGMFYHIPGWAYEEPKGEVLDPIKLLNSYGFGLCYQDGPLLEATWDAGGFKHTRAWFLTGHTVAEVFYDGQYHYYDSDEMGYTTLGTGSFKDNPVASIQQLEADPNLMLSKLKSPKEVKPGAVDNPWYNADVRAAGIGDTASMFTTKNNYVYAYRRYPQGHTMDFVLRPGERIVRYYKQPDSKLFYLPYKNDGKDWKEFPQDYGGSLLVNNGPHSEKDNRLWSTGVIEYQPNVESGSLAHAAKQVVFDMPSPYVMIGAKFSMKVALASAEQKLVVETSTDTGHSWIEAASLTGPYSGVWEAEPKAIASSQHGILNAVAGRYDYWVRLTLNGAGGTIKHSVSDLKLATIFEFNPRTLPMIVPGKNVLNFESKDEVRHVLPVYPGQAQDFANQFHNIMYASESGQGYLQNTADNTGEMIFKLSSDGAGELAGFDAGGRFLDLTGGLAPDKLTAETRKITPWPVDSKAVQTASLAWSEQPNGPWKVLWSYDPKIAWPDGKTVNQVLRWPEVDRSVRDLHGAAKPIYVRYQFRNLAVDDIRLATIIRPPSSASKLMITHSWSEDGKPGQFTEEVDGSKSKTYQFDVPTGAGFENGALVMAAQ